METLKVQAANQCLREEMMTVLRAELIKGGLIAGTFVVERSPDSDFLSVVWQEDGKVPVSMKICDPRDDAELGRKAAREFLVKWREAAEVRPSRPRRRR
jgi:hypothetical protein